MFEQTFKTIDDVLWKEAGCATELDYTEQTSWILFLKHLDDLEKANAQKAELKGETYRPIIDKPHRWSAWAAPKSNGAFDHDNALTGDDLIRYVDAELFPYLKRFRTRAEGPNTIEYKIGEIFPEIENKFRSGYSLRDALELVDQLSVRSQREKHELSHLYEAKLRNMGNAGRNGGEYYTPRPLIRAMIKVVNPKVGERIYDGACGSAGFLCEAFDYLLPRADTTTARKVLQGRRPSSARRRRASLATTSCSPIRRSAARSGRRCSRIFTIKTGETAFLFLQHFIKSLKAGGRAGIVIKNTFLSNTDNASVALRKQLLEDCDLRTVLDMPGGTFQGAGVKTVVLFFEKSSATRTIWFYKLDPGRNLGKTNPLNDDDLKDFVALQATFADSENSWTVDVKNVEKTTYDLSVKNPNKADETELRDPKDIIAEMAALDAESAGILERIRGML